MQTKTLFRNLSRAHVVALSTAGLLMGTAVILKAGTPDAKDRREVTLEVADRLIDSRTTEHEILPAESVSLAADRNLTLAMADRSPGVLDADPASPAVSLPGAADGMVDESAQVASLGLDAGEAIRDTDTLDWVTLTVRKGDSMSSLFKRAGLGSDLLFRIDASLDEKRWARIYPGEEIRFGLTTGQSLGELRLQRSELESWRIRPVDNSGRFELEKVVKPTVAVPAYAEGAISSVFYTAAQQAGLDDRMIMELAVLFGWDVDFALDIRKGDSFRVVYEDIHLEGKKIGTGDILAAQFTNRGQTYTAVRHIHQDGTTRYYNEEGASVKKAFLRSPIDFARISSHFSLARKHPVLHRLRAHQGTDYAASRGTPIKATGDGKVVLAGVKGGYGNTVVLQHGQAITTLYAHMTNFARGVRNGSRVSQGQIVGYVGSTGLATGPHLHYEFRVNGVPKNPVTVSLPDAHPVPDSEKTAFLKEAKNMLATLESYAGGYQIASRDSDSANHRL